MLLAEYWQLLRTPYKAVNREAERGEWETRAFQLALGQRGQIVLFAVRVIRPPVLDSPQTVVRVLRQAFRDLYGGGGAGQGLGFRV